LREAGENLELEIELELELAASIAKYYIRSFSLEPSAATKTDTKTFKIRRIQKRGPLSGPLSSCWTIWGKRWLKQASAIKPSSQQLT
jgi:hypothetical protein